MTVSAANNTPSPIQYTQLRTNQADQVKATVSQRKDAAATADTQQKRVQDQAVESQTADDRRNEAVKQGGEINITA